MQPTKRSLEQELSPVELWNQDPRKKNYNISFPRTLIPARNSRDVEELSKRFFPAIKENDVLKKIDTATMDIWKNCFKSGDTREEISNATLVDRCITIHATGGYWMFFVPSIGEVILQLPEEIVSSEKEYYFTTKLISYEPRVAMIATDYHIGITEIYQQESLKKRKK